jgi:hypothetical protein
MKNKNRKSPLRMRGKGLTTYAEKNINKPLLLDDVFLSNTIRENAPAVFAPPPHFQFRLFGLGFLNNAKHRQQNRTLAQS